MAFDRNGNYFYARPYSVGRRNLGEGNKYGALDAVNNAYAEADMAKRDAAERDYARRINTEERGYRDQQAQVAEERRRFELGREDQAARRSQFDGLMRMLFGGGEPQPMEQNALRMRARSPMPMYDQPDDGIDRRGINNSLARFIRGGM